jgi:hypothetical protein
MSGTSGTLTVLQGNTLWVTVADGWVVKVKLTKATTVMRNATSTKGALRPGDTSSCRERRQRTERSRPPRSPRRPRASPLQDSEVFPAAPAAEVDDQALRRPNGGRGSPPLTSAHTTWS